MRAAGPRGVLVAVAVLLAILAATARADTPPVQPTTPLAQLTVDPSQTAPALNFGSGRKQSSVIVRFLASEPLPSTPVADLIDFQTSDGKELDGTVTSKVTLTQAGRTVLVTLSVHPNNGVEPGTYTSQLLLRAPGVADARSTITVKLEPAAVHLANLYAVLLLFLGAAVGTFARWIATEASTLKKLQDRLAAVTASLHGFEPLPDTFRTKLIQVRVQLANDDASGADATLKDLEAQLNAAIDVARKAAAISQFVAAQEARIASMGDLGENAGKLAQAIGAERGLIDRMTEAPDFSSDAGSAKRVEYLQDGQFFSAFLEAYADPAKRDALEAALKSFMRGDFKDGDSKTLAVTGVVEQPQGTPLAAVLSTPAPPPPTRRPSVSHWLIRNAPLIGAGFTALGLVILGLFTVYDPSTTFRTDAFQDAVKLLAWGMGSALAGMGVADIAGKLTAGKAGAAP